MYLAIDIGGTKTLLAVFDYKGRVRESRKFPTDHDYETFKRDLAAAVEKLSTKKFKAAGVGVPGRLDREHGVAIAFGNLPWRDVPIEADMARILHCPVKIENDTKLAGLSEGRLIKNEFKKVLYVTISTGISNALIVDGNIDPNLADSEAGNMLFEHDGKLQRWEAFASGKAIVERFGKKAKDITDPQAWYIIARNIAVGLIDLIATLTPDVVVIGGGVGSHFEKFADRLEEELKLYENPLLSVPPIRKATRPEEAVIYGCYELVRQ